MRQEHEKIRVDLPKEWLDRLREARPGESLPSVFRNMVKRWLNGQGITVEPWRTNCGSYERELKPIEEVCSVQQWRRKKAFQAAQNKVRCQRYRGRKKAAKQRGEAYPPVEIKWRFSPNGEVHASDIPDKESAIIHRSGSFESMSRHTLQEVYEAIKNHPGELPERYLRFLAKHRHLELDS